MDRIVHGQPAAEALAVEVTRLEKSRVFLITNKSLAGGSRVAAIVRELGDRYAGQFAGVTAHGPRQSVIDGADAARFLRWVAEAFAQPFLLSVQG